MNKAILDYILLFLGFVFTFIIPGLCIVNTFFPKLPSRIKIALIPIFSVLSSTYLIYFASLLLGFSRQTVLLCVLLFLPWFIYILINSLRLKHIRRFVFGNKYQLSLGLLIFTLFFIALYPAIFTWHNGYIVMASVNWQDTAMHMGIIESIAQGNFPPQAPYYSGTPLNYYYFTDFHSSILVLLFGHFFPRVLVYTNSLFAAMFSLSLFAVSYEVLRKKWLATLSSLLGVLFGNMMFIRFVQDIFKSSGDQSIFTRIIDLLTNNNYSMEYEKLFQMPSMADYFLQNRPMMVGLPVCAVLILLIARGFNKHEVSLIFLSGIISGLLMKFQYFAILIGIIAFFVALPVYLNIRNIKFLCKSVVLFLLPIIVLSLPFLRTTVVNGNSIFDVILNDFSFGSWERGRSLVWHLLFILSNFGIPLLLSLAFGLIQTLKILLGKKINKEAYFLFLLSLVLFAIPYLCRFTVYKGDMFKFFFFMVIPLVAVSVYFLNILFNKRRYLKVIVFSLLIFIICTTSLLTLGDSILNKTLAYEANDYISGLWIRLNTPQKSVFISMPTVHTPITQIGGRLRVLSYINWPYSHGYNTGEDNVFERLKKIESVYSTNDPRVVRDVIKRYNANYIFYGKEEKDKYPEAEKFFVAQDFLKLVYNTGNIKIYEVEKNI